ncbi:hypothetical protein GJ496_005842 [Pomphorhynchus laevis]|nr:hypothetical protein GJ496_005842 [Pomphorhynchus laevis]
MAWLIEDYKTRKYLFLERDVTYTIGRHKSCNLSISDDASLSRIQFYIIPSETTVKVRNNSKFPTIIDSVPVKDEIDIVHHDKIYIITCGESTRLKLYPPLTVVDYDSSVSGIISKRLIVKDKDSVRAPFNIIKSNVVYLIDKQIEWAPFVEHCDGLSSDSYEHFTLLLPKKRTKLSSASSKDSAETVDYNDFDKPNSPERHIYQFSDRTDNDIDTVHKPATGAWITCGHKDNRNDDLVTAIDTDDLIVLKCQKQRTRFVGEHKNKVCPEIIGRSDLKVHKSPQKRIDDFLQDHLSS